MNKLKSQLTRVRNSEGFSLVELLVAIAVLAVFLSGVFAFLLGASNAWRTGQNTTNMTENARAGLNIMTRELKQASQITSASDNQVSFLVDFGTGDGVQTITYGFTPGTGGTSGQVWRNSPGSVLINDASNIQFTYFGNDYRCDANGDGSIAYSELQS